MQEDGIALCRVTVGKSVIVEICSKQSINYQVILLHCIVSKLCRDTLDLMRVFLHCVRLQLDWVDLQLALLESRECTQVQHSEEKLMK